MILSVGFIHLSFLVLILPSTIHIFFIRLLFFMLNFSLLKTIVSHLFAFVLMIMLESSFTNLHCADN